MFQAGYNYQLTRKDTIAVSYGFDAFRYSDGLQSINNNSFEFHYARRVTGQAGVSNRRRAEYCLLKYCDFGQFHAIGWNCQRWNSNQCHASLLGFGCECDVPVAAAWRLRHHTTMA